VYTRDVESVVPHLLVSCVPTCCVTFC